MMRKRHCEIKDEMESLNYHHITTLIGKAILPANGHCKLQRSAKMKNERSLNSSLAQGM